MVSDYFLERKKGMKNKILSFAIVLCMLFGIMVMPVGAEITEGAFTYYVSNEKTATITEVDKTISGFVEIPSNTADGYPVIRIGDEAFRECKDIFVVTIPSSVKSIGDAAFFGCTGLAVVDAAQGLEGIGLYAFANCTGLNRVCLQEGVTAIGEAAFIGCTGLCELFIPNTIASIGDAAFNGCQNLNVFYDGTEQDWNSINIWGNNEALLNAKITYLRGQGSSGSSYYDKTGDCGDNARWVFDEGTGTLTIKGTGALWTNLEYSDYSYPWGEYRFRIAEIVIEEGITEIPIDAFSDEFALKKVYIPATVTKIGEYAFYNDDSLQAAYFAGNAPIIEGKSISFNQDLIIYYTPNATGWTDSEYYDSNEQTWHGYELKIWANGSGSGESSGSGSTGGSGGNSSGELQQLPAPNNLRWNEDEDGQVAYGSISWDSVEDCEGEYGITVYRDGEEVFHTSWSGLYEGDRQSVDLVHSNVFKESGHYTFSVVAEGDGIQWADSEPRMSGGFHFTAPDQKLETPTELQWAGNGILRHKAVENAGAYLYNLYNDKSKKVGSLWDYHNTPLVSETGYAEKDLSKYMVQVSGWAEDLKGIYVAVTALTYNINEYQNSDESVFSAIYNIEAAESAAESSMNSLLEDIDNETSTATEALDSFLEQMEDSNIENTDIAISMQQNEQFVNSISRLEAAYCEETGIEVAVGNNEEDNEYLETRGIDVSKVTIVGAALNSQDGSDVNINFSKVEEMPQVNESFYKNTVAVNIGIEGVKDAEKLDIPIQIKMPVPTGVLPERLVIIHYHADGTQEEIHPAVSYDGEGKAYVTFVLTSFSTFVFCNEQETAPAPSSSGGGGGGGGVSTYTVKFDTNGGNELKNLNIQKGQAIGAIQTPQKKGYVFDGWYADKELTKPYSADEKVTAATTLYAGWKVDPVRQLTLTIGDKNATVFGEAKSNDVAPIIRNERTMLPIRFIAEALGAEVSWDSANKVVTITNADIEIKITIDKGTATVNGEEITLDSPAFIENDRTFLPLRFVSENLGAEVEWVAETKQVVITKPIEE